MRNSVKVVIDAYDGNVDAYIADPTDPVIETYKRDVDRTLIRENLKLTPDERMKKMLSMLRLVEEVRRSSTAPS